MLCMIIVLCELHLDPKDHFSGAFRAFWKRECASSIGQPARHTSWPHAHYLLGVSMFDCELFQSLSLPLLSRAWTICAPSLCFSVSVFQGSSQRVRSRSENGKGFVWAVSSCQDSHPSRNGCDVNHVPPYPMNVGAPITSQRVLDLPLSAAPCKSPEGSKDSADQKSDHSHNAREEGCATEKDAFQPHSSIHSLDDSVGLCIRSHRDSIFAG